MVLSGAVASITVLDGLFGGTTTATGDLSKFVRAHAEDAAGRIIYEEFVRSFDGRAVFHLGPTARWTAAGQAVRCVGETGHLRFGKWRASASDEFTVT